MNKKGSRRVTAIRSALAVSAVVAALVLVDGLHTPILAQRGEVIVSVRIEGLNSGQSMGGRVQLSSETASTQILNHGDHAIVAEGEPVTLTALPESGSVFYQWQGSIIIGTPSLTTAFDSDAVIKLVLTDDPEEDGKDMDANPVSAQQFTGIDLGTSHLESMEDGTTENTQTIVMPGGGSETLTEIWVDFYHGGSEHGTEENPYDTLSEGASAASDLAGPSNPISVKIKPGTSLNTPTIDPDNPIKLEAPIGPARIGGGVLPYTYTLTTATVGTGSVTGGGEYPANAAAVISAFASGVWDFSHWEGDAAGYKTPRPIEMDSDKSVTAVFVANAAQLVVTGANIDNMGNDPLPDTVTAGDSIDIKWFVSNMGATADSADDDWTDNVFLSRDDVYDEQDKALATAATISEQESYTGSATITIPDVSPGDYCLLIRTDLEEEVTHTASGRDAAVLVHELTIIDSELTL